MGPRGFYDGFPGGGRQWVAGDGPYNANLVGDAGVAFLAVGVVLLLAAMWMDARLIQAAAVAAAVHVNRSRPSNPQLQTPAKERR